MISKKNETPRLGRIVPFLVLTVFLDLVGFGIILPLLPSYVADMGGSPQTVGVLFASFAGAQFFATPALGRISDRFGRRRVIFISLATNALAMTLFAVAASRHALALLFASRLLAGATSGNIGACQATIADVSSGPERVRAMGKLGAGIGLGMMLGPWIGGRASKFGEAAPPLAAAILAVVALAGVLLFLPETNPNLNARDPIHAGKQAVSARPKLSLRALASNPKIAVVMGLYFLTFFYMTSLQTSLALVAHDRFAWSKEHIGDLFGIFGACTLVTQFALVGPISARVKPATVATSAALLSAGALACIGLSSVVSGLIGGLVVLAIGVGLTQPLLASLASQYAGKDQQGTVLGFAQSSGSLARAVGPLVWGAIYQHVGPTAAFLGGTASATIASLVAIGARPDPANAKDA